MQAGQKLDEQIAEKVMGWKPPPFRARNGELWENTWTLPTGGPSIVLNFSADIAAANAVVNTIAANGGTVHIHNEFPGVWIAIVRLDREASYTTDKVERAETIPHAICLAALAAVEAGAKHTADKLTAEAQKLGLYS